MSSRTRLGSKDSKQSTGVMWKGRKDFLLAQAQVLVILAIAYIGMHYARNVVDCSGKTMTNHVFLLHTSFSIGNTWPESYPRNENHNPTMFWIMNAALGVAAFATLKHDANGSSRGVQLLSRSQTEEWKGWMQFAFIMYHYYRAYFVYNEIRVFVSAVSQVYGGVLLRA